MWRIDRIGIWKWIYIYIYIFFFYGSGKPKCNGSGIGTPSRGTCCFIIGINSMRESDHKELESLYNAPSAEWIRQPIRWQVPSVLKTTYKVPTSATAAVGEHFRYAAQLALLRVAEGVDGSGVGEEGNVVGATGHLLHGDVLQQPHLGTAHVLQERM
jgi:hypothetical protein